MIISLETASPIEIIWTLITGITLGINIWAVADAYTDVLLLKKLGINGTRKVTSRTQVFRELGRLYRSLLFFLAGLFFLSLPAVKPSNSVSNLLGGVFISIALVDLFQMIYERKQRKKVLGIGKANALRAMGQVQRIEDLKQALREGDQQIPARGPDPTEEHTGERRRESRDPE